MLNVTSIYSSGDLVLQRPIETTTIFLAVFLVSSILEFLMDTAADVPNKYFRVMFNTVITEVMVIGILVLALLFTSSVYEWPALWVFIFKWCMMCLFLMVVFFVILIALLLLIARLSVRRWEAYEGVEMDATTGAGAAAGGAAAVATGGSGGGGWIRLMVATLLDWRPQYKASYQRFTVALRAFGYDASMGVRYSAYLSKLMRRNVINTTDLTWVSWVCLATAVVLNGLRTEATMQASLAGDENVSDDLSYDQRVTNYVSYIFVVGYLGLALFLGVHLTLLHRLNVFLEIDEGGGGGRGGGAAAIARRQRLAAAAGVAAAAAADDDDQTLGAPLHRPNGPATPLDMLDDSRAYLFRRSLEATLEIIQVLLLFQEWYIATFSAGFMYQITMKMPVATGVVLATLGFLPPVIAMLCIPRLLLTVTMLGGLGSNLDERAVQAIIRLAKLPEDELPAKMRRRPPPSQQQQRPLPPAQVPLAAQPSLLMREMSTL